MGCKKALTSAAQGHQLGGSKHFRAQSLQHIATSWEAAGLSAGARPCCTLSLAGCQQGSVQGHGPVPHCHWLEGRELSAGAQIFATHIYGSHTSRGAPSLAHSAAVLAISDGLHMNLARRTWLRWATASIGAPFACPFGSVSCTAHTYSLDHFPHEPQQYAAA